jgi:elongator complex protein 4
MDALFGGGLPVGTVLLIEDYAEHTPNTHLLLKLFLAEGVMCGHSLFLASASEDPAELLKKLPSALGEGRSAQSGTVPSSAAPAPGQAEVDQMKIAWRYQNLPKVQVPCSTIIIGLLCWQTLSTFLQSSLSSRFGHFFDVTSTMDPGRLASVDTTTFDVSKQLAARSSRRSSDLYRLLKSQIESKIISGNFSVDSQNSTQQRNILRIALHHIGSPLWVDEEFSNHHHDPLSPSSSSSAPCLLHFLHALRGLLRRAYAVAVITMPTNLIEDRVFASHLRRLCDSAVRISCFSNEHYEGTFELIKLPCLNSLTPHLPESLDLIFNMKRKHFCIEKHHLPPELSNTASRAQEDSEVDKKGSGQGPKVGLVLEDEGSEVGKPKPQLSKHNIDF